MATFPSLPSSNFSGVVTSTCGNFRKRYANGRCTANYSRSRCPICGELEWAYQQDACRRAREWAMDLVAQQNAEFHVPSGPRIEDLFDRYETDPNEDYYM